jgi:hypothetical protein
MLDGLVALGTDGNFSAVVSVIHDSLLPTRSASFSCRMHCESS